MNEDAVTAKRNAYCVICFTKFTSKRPEFIPRNLNCGHSYCTGCLLKLQEYQGKLLECPRCKVRSFLPLDGVLGLPKNYDLLKAAMDSNEADQELCNFCIRKLVYPPRPVTLNCRDCEVLFCGLCSDEIHKQLEFRTHSICLASAESDINGNDTKPARIHSGSLQRKTSSRPTLRRFNSSLEALPECDKHGEKLKLYCNQCKAVCCTFCQIEGDHKDHKIIHIHEAEDLDKRKLCRQQQKVDEYGEKFIKSRSDVQKTIEATKQNDIRLHDVVRRYFRELRMAVDHGEKIILEEVGKRNKATLRALNEQLSSMIAISSRAKTASRRCDEILSLDYFELMEARQDVENDVENVLKMECKTEPCASSKLQCQFPNHETLLNELRTCAKIVTVPDAPVRLYCKLTEPTIISVQWSAPPTSPFIYPIQEYILQNNTEEDNAFVDVYKGSSTTVLLNAQDGQVLNDVKCKPDRQISKLENRVQFRVAAINIVGQSDWSSPFALRVPGHGSSTSIGESQKYLKVSLIVIGGLLYESWRQQDSMYGVEMVFWGLDKPRSRVYLWDCDHGRKC